MIDKEIYGYKPDYAVHPGEYLEEVMESREICKKELAVCLGIGVKRLNLIIHKQAMLTSELAVRLEKTLGISANIWNNLNADYSLFHNRLKEEKELKQKNKLKEKFELDVAVPSELTV